MQIRGRQGRFGKRAAFAVMAAAFVVLTPAAAFAHVEITPSSAPRGSDAELSFSVPNEEATANTTQVVIVFPTDHPIPTVDVLPLAGWSYKVDTTHLSKPVQTDDGPVSDIVSQITWSGGAIKPGEFQNFVVSAGPLPDADQIVFKALQTYSDGTIVRWIETPSSNGVEPEHPAPVLTLTKGGDGTTPAATSTSSSSSNDPGKTIAIIALIVGAVGLVVGGIALVRARAS